MLLAGTEPGEAAIRHKHRVAVPGTGRFTAVAVAVIQALCASICALGANCSGRAPQTCAAHLAESHGAGGEAGEGVACGGVAPHAAVAILGERVTVGVGHAGARPLDGAGNRQQEFADISRSAVGIGVAEAVAETVDTDEAFRAFAKTAGFTFVLGACGQTAANHTTVSERAVGAFVGGGGAVLLNEIAAARWETLRVPGSSDIETDVASKAVLRDAVTARERASTAGAG